MIARVQVDPEFRVLERRPLFEIPDRVLRFGFGVSYDVSADDQRFLMIRLQQVGGATADQSRVILVLNWFEELKNRVPN